MAVIATRMRRDFILSCAVAITMLVSALASAEPMKFHGSPAMSPSLIGGNAWYIFADGEIDPGVDERLERFLTEKNVPRKSAVFFNSPGGNLLAGMKLGRLIRSRGLFTYVGTKREPTKDRLWERTNPGECYSACTLAFLGGTHRFYNEGSEYGVHRFYSPTKRSYDADAAQIMSAAIIQYMQDMGVDPELFSFMSRAGASEIVRLSEREQRRLHVVNGGLQPTKWTLESGAAGVYLKGERETWRGINKFLLICVPAKGLILHVIYDPEGRGDEIINKLNAHSLMLDKDRMLISGLQSMPTKLVNGWINAFYLLTPDLVRRIVTARTVGIAMQPSYKSPIFMGFQEMELDGARDKLAGLLDLCRIGGVQR